MWNLPKLKRKAPDQMCETKFLQMCSFSIISTSLHSFNLSFLLLFYAVSTDKTNKRKFLENYWAVAILPTVSKIYEPVMQKQIIDYIGKFISPFLCGYRNEFSTQYALL